MKAAYGSKPNYGKPSNGVLMSSQIARTRSIMRWALTRSNSLILDGLN
jgi:hypothetical protein